MLVRAMSSRGATASLGRPLVAGLVVSSALLSVVSWYTTQQGMALYLSPWVALLASAGIQSALLLVAWLSGVSEARRGLLVAVYALTATVSIAFSYVSLHTWFAARERPALVERRLYDELAATTGRAQELLTAATAEGERHVLALQEMTAAEKAHGYVSRAEDADPWLDRVREAVAREARSYGAAYPEGVGAGLRHTAFDRYTRLAEQTLARLRQSQQALAASRAEARPLEPTETQLRGLRQVFDAIPWSEVRDTLHATFDVPALPAYSDFVDRTATGQEDLILAFTELLAAPTERHVLAFTLAAFIDVIVFMLAFAAGPLFFGAPEERWVAAAAAIDSVDQQVFVRDLLCKLTPSVQGPARLELARLSPGEQQLVLLLESRGLAAPLAEGDRRGYLLDPCVHRGLADALVERRLPLRATAPQEAGVRS